MTKASTPRCAPVAAAIAVLLLLGRPVAAVTYIVDQRHPQASDQNAGTAEAPFKTIGRAAGVVAAGDAVTIRTGVYAAAPGQALFRWGCAWRHNKACETLAEVSQELGLEQGSRATPFVFTDYLTRDFRVPPGSPALTMDCYPQGDVPGVRLGLAGK